MEITEDGNLLEHPPLQQGVLWGLARLAQIRPELLNDVSIHVHPFLTSRDPMLRGLAAWIMGLLGGGESDSALEALLEDETEVTIYVNGTERVCRLSDLARQALAANV